MGKPTGFSEPEESSCPGKVLVRNTSTSHRLTQKFLAIEGASSIDY